MPVRIYTSDELCPNCGCNIYDTLANHVYSEGGRNFETECPSCETMLEIEVEAVPAFGIAKVAVEHSAHPTPPTKPVNYCNPVNGVHAPFCTGHETAGG